MEQATSQKPGRILRGAAIWIPTVILGLFYVMQGLMKVIPNPGWEERFRAWGDLSPLSKLQQADLEIYLPSTVLVKVDRASMATSLEVRSPILDHRVVEFAWSLPIDLRIEPGGGKYVLRKRGLLQVLPYCSNA